MAIPSNATLNPQMVREIRRLRAEGWTQPALARRFGVGPNQIGKICRGEVWRNVTGGEPVLTDTEAHLRLLEQQQEPLLRIDTEEHQGMLERLAKLSSEVEARKVVAPMATATAISTLSAEVSERAAAYLTPNGSGGVEELIKSITPEMRQRFEAEAYGKLMAQRQLEADAREAEARERDRDKAQSTTTTTAENVQPAAEAILNAERLLETLKDENQS